MSVYKEYNVNYSDSIFHKTPTNASFFSNRFHILIYACGYLGLVFLLSDYKTHDIRTDDGWWP